MLFLFFLITWSHLSPAENKEVLFSEGQMIFVEYPLIVISDTEIPPKIYWPTSLTFQEGT